MKILHFSDIHYWKIQIGSDPYYPKRFLGLMNLVFSRKNHFPPPLADTVINAIRQEEADAFAKEHKIQTSGAQPAAKAAAAEEASQGVLI